MARQARELVVPTTQQIKAWAMFSLAWPEVVRWLRRSYAEWEREGVAFDGDSTVIGKHLARLENTATQKIIEPDENGGHKAPRQPTLEDWAQSLMADFRLPEDTPWLRDDRLFFFSGKWEMSKMIAACPMVREKDSGEAVCDWLTLRLDAFTEAFSMNYKYFFLIFLPKCHLP
jgi:hypothetical protein